MGAEALLELLKLVLGEHDRDQGLGLHVLAVIDEDLAQDHEVIRSVMRRADGEYLDTATLADAQVTGVLDRELLIVVEKALQLAALPFAIAVDETDGVVRARVKGASGPELPFSKGQRTALGVIASLFWAELRQHRVAAIGLEESDWDLPTFNAMWELLTAQLPGHQIGELQTLIVISGGPFTTQRHCSSDTSARYIVRNGHLSTRKRPSDVEAALGTLSRHKGRLIVLFLGAGFSYSSGLPLGDEARDYALQQFFSPGRYQQYELATRFYEWIVDNRRLLEGETSIGRAEFVERLTLERVLREEFYREPRVDSPTLDWMMKRNERAAAAITPGRSALKRLLDEDSRVVIVTVNFDTLLEHDLGQRLNVLVNEEQFREAPQLIQDYIEAGGKVPFLKLHGTLENRGSIVADVEATALGLTAAGTAAIQALTKRDRPIPWLYVGYSMRDQDVSQVLALEGFAAGAIEAWVDPLPPESVTAFAIENRLARWRQAGQPDIQPRLITETADRFLARFAEAWPARLE